MFKATQHHISERDEYMPPIKKEQIIIRLSPRLKKQLELKAIEKEMNVSELVRLLIENMINEDK